VTFSVVHDTLGALLGSAASPNPPVAASRVHKQGATMEGNTRNTQSPKPLASTSTRRSWTRRKFLGATAGTLAAAGVAARAQSAAKPGRILGANDRIRMGIIGSGGMGRYHVVSMLDNFKDVEFIAICDVSEAARNEAAKLAADRGSTNCKLFNEHEKLLEMKEIDGVVIGSPDHWHARHLIDTVNAGKDAYCEKPMSWSIEQGLEMIKAVRATDRIVQIGMQRRSTPPVMEAKKIIDSGFLGEVSLVRAQWYWHMQETLDPAAVKVNGKVDWDRFQAPVPPEKRRPFDPVRYARWRYFWDYSGGNMTDQGTHLMDVIQWFFNDSKPPLAAQEAGEVYQLKGYETPDTFCAIFEYPKFMATWTLTYTNNWTNGWSIIVHGSKGSLELDDFGARFLDNNHWIPDWRTKAPPPKHEIKGGLRVDLHEKNFFDCMRSRKEPNAPVEIGHQAVTALHLANAAHHARRRVTLDPQTYKVS